MIVEVLTPVSIALDSTAPAAGGVGPGRGRDRGGREPRQGGRICAKLADGNNIRIDKMIAVK